MEFFVVLNHNSPISMSLWHNQLKQKSDLPKIAIFTISPNVPITARLMTNSLHHVKLKHMIDNLILVRLGTDLMKHYGNSTLFYIKLQKNLLWDDYYEICFCFQERDRWDYLSASCRGEVWTFHVSTTKVKHLYTTKTLRKT